MWHASDHTGQVWGDEDGESWYIEERLTLAEMIPRVREFEIECNDESVWREEYESNVGAGYVSHCWIVEDAGDEERLVIIRGFWRVLGARIFLGAKPLTTLHAGCGPFNV